MASDEFDVGINNTLHPSKSSPSSTTNEDTAPSDHLARFRLFEPGEVIFYQGDRGAEAYVIKSGHVTIAQSSSSEQITTGPGQIIGEMAVISDMPRIATATASEETVCVALSRLAMRRMMDSVDLEMRTLIEFLVDYIRDLAGGEAVDHEEARRNKRILEILMETPDTQTHLALQEPFFRMLCDSLIDRAKVG